MFFTFCCHWQSSCSSPQHLICEMSFITCMKHYFYYENIYKTSDFIYCQTNLHHPLPLHPITLTTLITSTFSTLSALFLCHFWYPEKSFLPTANLFHIHTNICSLDVGFSFSIIPSTFTSLVSYILSGLQLTPSDVINGGVTIRFSLFFLKVRYILMMSDTIHMLISNLNFVIL